MLWLFVVLAMASSVHSTSAQTTSETTVSIEITDAGTLDAYWENPGAAFLTEGENPALTAAGGVTATAVFTLVVEDTRVSKERPGYIVSVSASPFVASDSGGVIEPAQLTIVDLDDPGNQQVIGATLDLPVAVLSVDANASSLNTSIAIAVSMAIPAGTPLGSYSGELIVDIIPVLGEGV
jgi:hypothetical protein